MLREFGLQRADLPLVRVKPPVRNFLLVDLGFRIQVVSFLHLSDQTFHDVLLRFYSWPEVLSRPRALVVLAMLVVRNAPELRELADALDVDVAELNVGDAGETLVLLVSSTFV